MSHRVLGPTEIFYLNQYASGAFPMAAQGLDGAPQQIRWWDPPLRAVLPISDLHVSKSLRRLIEKAPYDIRVDTAFDAVLVACASSHGPTWLSPAIQDVFSSLHRAGFAHSVECWTPDNRLVGGLYGLALGGAFCGESMFSHESNASKVALVHLCARLAAGGFTLLDAQILNDHTARFGAYEIPRQMYQEALRAALRVTADFHMRHRPPATEAQRVRAYLGRENLKKDLTIS